ARAPNCGHSHRRPSPEEEPTAACVLIRTLGGAQPPVLPFYVNGTQVHLQQDRRRVPTEKCRETARTVSRENERSRLLTMAHRWELIANHNANAEGASENGRRASKARARNEVRIKLALIERRPRRPRLGGGGGDGQRHWHDRRAAGETIP